ncbi:glucose-6-phosphate isomerase [Sphingomonas yabuuchiae]
MAADWSTIESLPQTPLLDLFANDPNRLASLSLDVAGIHFDWSKTHLTREAVAAFADLAKASGLAAKRDALFGGEVVNVTEGRAVEHTAERGEGNPESVAVARQSHARMRALIDAIEAEALGPIRHVLHIGIGGSALGPDLLVDALGRDSDRYDVAIVSNVDGVALEEVFKRFDPAATLLVVASKTFTTTETMLNATSALQWMTESGVEDPYGKVIALTANPEKAVEWGVDETRILPFAESVGGRYSLWSTIGFPAALGLGWDAFEELLEGAAEMDRHFRLTDLAQNAPALAAFADLYYTQVRHAETRAPFAYDERLRLLLLSPAAGDGVERQGRDRRRPARRTADRRDHLGRGRHRCAACGVPAAPPGHAPRPRRVHRGHRAGRCAERRSSPPAAAQRLCAGCGADEGQDGRRSRAQLFGRSSVLDHPARHARPAHAGRADRLYEHRVFVNGVLLGINSFDQFGVELGKEMAKAADQGGQDFDPSTEDLIKRAFGE